MKDIPEGVKDFISSSIESVDQLRMLLLVQATPDQDWTVDALARHLAMKPEKVADDLSKLAFLGLLARQPDLTYRYAPQTAEQRNMVCSLVQLDRERPVTLINLVRDRKRQ